MSGMKKITVALCQINVAVGAIRANADKMAAAAGEAAARGARLILFPELALCGYPPEDLVLKPHFIRDCTAALHDLQARLPAGSVTIFGAPWTEQQKVFNGAVVCAGGEVRGVYKKIALPNYGVFDEKRIFVPGERPLILNFGGARIGVHICEDSWLPDEPACRLLAPFQLDGLVNISASPYERGKLSRREAVLQKTAVKLDTLLLYCNLVGGQDELVFDGASMVVSPKGPTCMRGRQFAEETLYFNLPAPRKGAHSKQADADIIDIPVTGAAEITSSPADSAVAPALGPAEEVYAALKTGLRDYVNKNAFQNCVVALSGGIDSALVAAIAADALGAERVHGITMPSRFSSEATRADAVQLARNLKIDFRTVAIESLFKAYLNELTGQWPGKAPDITEENLQARIRANIIMALSNKFGWLVLTTGNKSELAMGYCTLYGDMVGGFAVIKDVPKTLVFELARWRNSQDTVPVIPPSTIERPPSAELRPDQKDSDTLPPYEILDPILELYIEQHCGLEEIMARGFDGDIVRMTVRTVDRNEYKRRQGAPGIKITPCAFGRERRMPITNQYWS